MDWTGTWDVAASPDFDDYLWMEGQPYVKLEQKGSRVEGEYQLGLQSGNIDGRLKKDGSVGVRCVGAPGQ
jgi:hypothetical protein